MTLKFLFLTSLLTFSVARAATESPGCLPASRFVAIAELYQLDGEQSDANDTVRQLKQIKAKACSGEYSSSSTISYSNGRTATSSAGSDSSTWYWPNGRTITSLAGGPSSSIYFPNGRKFTSLFLSLGASYYYSNGRTLTSLAGRKGASIYDIEGRTLVSSAPAFEEDGHVDVIALIDYVVSLHGGITDPGLDCSMSQLKSEVGETIELVRAGRNSQAIDKLKEIKECLK